MSSDDTRDPREAADDDVRQRASERTIPEFLKRIVDAGVGKLAEQPENVRHFVQDLKLPKEVGGYLLTQIDETKNGLYRVVARELRDFLEHTNIADELTRVLTKLAFEVKMEIRFKPNEASSVGLPKPQLDSEVSLRANPSEPSEPRSKSKFPSRRRT